MYCTGPDVAVHGGSMPAYTKPGWPVASSYARNQANAVCVYSACVQCEHREQDERQSDG
jgi:hypothetical protein